MDRRLGTVVLLLAAVFVLTLALQGSAAAQAAGGARIEGGAKSSDYAGMKMSLAFPEPKPVTLDPRKTILQIVDMQEMFVGAEPRLKMWKGQEGIETIKKLLDLARRLDMTVIYQYSMAIPNPWEKRPKKFIHWGSIIDELKPVERAKEYYVQKPTHDIFFHTAMDDLLRQLPKEIDTVIVAGTVTGTCVLWATMGYRIRGYRTILPMDATIARTAEDQAQALNVMNIQGSNFPATVTLSNMITFEPAVKK